MTNKLVVIINSLKVPKIKKILLYEMKFIVLNYSCLQNPWLGGYCPQIPVLSVLSCPQLNLLNPPNKIPGYATVIIGRVFLKNSATNRECGSKDLQLKPTKYTRTCTCSSSSAPFVITSSFFISRTGISSIHSQDQEWLELPTYLHGMQRNKFTFHLYLQPHEQDGNFQLMTAFSCILNRGNWDLLHGGMASNMDGSCKYIE